MGLFTKNKSEDRLLIRCYCGGLFWGDSPQDVKQKHTGHRCMPATGGSVFEFIKLKLGLVR